MSDAYFLEVFIVMQWCSIGRVCLVGRLLAKMKQHGGFFCTNMALGGWGVGVAVSSRMHKSGVNRLTVQARTRSTESTEINGLVLTCYK